MDRKKSHTGCYEDISSKMKGVWLSCQNADVK